MPFLRKYNTLTVTGTTAIRVPMIKRGVVDFAIGADWTPAAGDVKVLVDGTAATNVTNLPTAQAGANTGAVWEFILTAAELSCKQCEVIISDAATKAVEDQSFIVETFGNASAMYQADFSLPNIPANVTQLLGTAWLTPGTAGTPDVNTKLINGVATTSVTTINANQGTTQPINFTGTAGSALAKSDVVDIAGAAVSATTAQLGVNVVNYNNAAVSTAASGIPKVDVDTIKTNAVVNAGTVTFPTTATLASTTNITAGTITTATNLTNAATAGDFTSTMKTSLNSSTPGVSAAGIQAIWDALTSNLTTVGSIGKRISDFLTGDAYVRLGAPAGASVSADIAAIRVDTNTTIPNLIAALNNISSANVKTQVVAALNTDTYAEPGQGAPPATTTLQLKMSYVYKAWRNKSTQTASQYSLFADDASTVDQKSATSDDGTTFTRQEIATGP